MKAIAKKKPIAVLIPEQVAKALSASNGSFVYYSMPKPNGIDQNPSAQITVGGFTFDTKKRLLQTGASVNGVKRRVVVGERVAAQLASLPQLSFGESGISTHVIDIEIEEEKQENIAKTACEVGFSETFSTTWVPCQAALEPSKEMITEEERRQLESKKASLNHKEKDKADVAEMNAAVEVSKKLAERIVSTIANVEAASVVPRGTRVNGVSLDKGMAIREISKNLSQGSLESIQGVAHENGASQALIQAQGRVARRNSPKFTN